MNVFEFTCEKLVVSSELARDPNGDSLVKDAFKKDLWKEHLNLCCSRGLFCLFEV